MNQAERYPIYIPAPAKGKQKRLADPLFRILSRLTGDRLHPAVTLAVGCNTVGLLLLIFCPALRLNGRLYGILSFSSLLQGNLLWRGATLLFVSAFLLSEAACYFYVKKKWAVLQILSIICMTAACLLSWYVLETQQTAQFSLEFSLVVGLLLMIAAWAVMLRHNRKHR